MRDHTDTSVIPYRDELLVELMGTDDYGSVDVMTYQFDYDNDARDIVVPRGEITSGHVSVIEAASADEGYRLMSG